MDTKLEIPQKEMSSNIKKPKNSFSKRDGFIREN
jgi:hypothetical protein